MFLNSRAVRKRSSGLYSTDRIRISSISLEIDGVIWRGRGFFEIEYQQRIVLRIGSGQQVKHRSAETVNVRRRLHSPTEELRRRITHRANRVTPFSCCVTQRAMPKSISITRPVLPSIIRFAGLRSR